MNTYLAEDVKQVEKLRSGPTLAVVLSKKNAKQNYAHPYTRVLPRFWRTMAGKHRDLD